jgi:hypothetical protein
MQVTTGPWWEPNFVEHWLFWFAVGVAGFSSIVVAGWVRRRLAQRRQVNGHFYGDESST